MPERKQHYRQIDRYFNLKVMASFMDVKHFEKDHRLNAIRVLRRASPSIHDCTTHWDGIFSFRQSAYSKFDNEQPNSDIRSDFEQTTISLLGFLDGKGLLPNIMELIFALQHRYSISTSTLVTLRDYVISISKKNKNAHRFESDIMHTNCKILNSESIASVYKQWFEAAFEQEKNVGTLESMITQSLCYNVNDYKAWECCVSLYKSQENANMSKLVLSLISAIELAPSPNMKLTALLLDSVSSSNVEYMENLVRIPPRIWLPFAPVIFSLNPNQLNIYKVIINMISINYPQLAYYYLHFIRQTYQSDCIVPMFLSSNYYQDVCLEINIYHRFISRQSPLQLEM